MESCEPWKLENQGMPHFEDGREQVVVKDQKVKPMEVDELVQQNEQKPLLNGKDHDKENVIKKEEIKTELVENDSNQISVISQELHMNSTDITENEIKKEEEIKKEPNSLEEEIKKEQNDDKVEVSSVIKNDSR